MTIEGVVTVNVAAAVELELTSVAVTVIAPVGPPEGTRNVQAKVPVAVAVMTPPVADPELQALYELIAIAPKVMVALPPCVNPAPVTTTCVLTGPPRIDSVMTGVEAEYAAEMMKFAAAGPWEMSTKLLFEPGVVMVVEPGIAPPAVAVNAVPDAHEVVPAAVKHAVYAVFGAKPEPDSVTTVPAGPLFGVRVRDAVVVENWTEMMKFAAAAPCEIATQAFPPDHVTVMLPGIAPAPLEVNWIAAGQPTADPLAAQQTL
jgi:hypothetical protein